MCLYEYLPSQPIPPEVFVRCGTRFVPSMIELRDSVCLAIPRRGDSFGGRLIG